MAEAAEAPRWPWSPPTSRQETEWRRLGRTAVVTVAWRLSDESSAGRSGPAGLGRPAGPGSIGDLGRSQSGADGHIGRHPLAHNERAAEEPHRSGRERGFERDLMKRVFAHGGHAVLRDMPEPQLRPNHVLVQTAFSAISAGTEG